MPLQKSESAALSLDSVVEQMRSVYQAQNYERLLLLFELHPIEAWYGIPTNELQAMIKEASLNTPGNSEMAYVFMKMSSLSGEESGEPALSVKKKAYSPQGLSWLTMAQMFRLRILGKPVEAFRLLETLEARIAPFVAFDISGGMRLFISVQSGVTAMLAGRMREALDFFTAAQLHPIVPSLSFLTRDAYVKSALIHALFGDMRVAEEQLKLAADIARTASWVEPLIDVGHVLAEAVLPGRDVETTLGRLNSMPLQDIGEMWPFYVTVLGRVYRHTGRMRDAKKLLEQFARLPLPKHDGQGYVGSVLGLEQAVLQAQQLDGSGVKFLATVEMRLPMTKLLGCVFHILNGQLQRAKRDAQKMRHETQKFRQLELSRLAVLANTHFVLQEYEECARVLTVVTELDGGMRPEEIIHFSSELRDFARARVPGWNTQAEEIYTSLAQTLAPKTDELSSREREVLVSVMKDGNREEAAARLFISRNTLQTHLRRIYRKLGVNSFDAAVLEAQRRHLL